jgi:hypothetical protein
MELTTILNRCHRFRGFIYEYARFSTDKKSIEVVVRPRIGSGRCPVWSILKFQCDGSRDTMVNG